MKNTKNDFFVWMNIIIPLVIGFFIYILSHSDTRFSDPLYKIVPQLETIKVDIPRGIRNYVPDFLWAYSFTFYLFHTMKNCSWIKICSISITLCVLLEIAQISDSFGGTFDIIDIIVEIIAAFIAKSIFIRRGM